jgi:hypothetical protein
VSDILDEASAEQWADAEDELLDLRRQAVEALTAAWGPPQTHSFEQDAERILAGEEVPSVVQDLAMFAFWRQADEWRRGDRTVWLVLGQLDKEFPIVLMLAVTAQPLP